MTGPVPELGEADPLSCFITVVQAAHHFDIHDQGVPDHHDTYPLRDHPALLHGPNGKSAGEFDLEFTIIRT